METIEIIDLLSIDTKWCSKNDRIVDKIINDILKIIRMKEVIEISQSDKIIFSDNVIEKYTDDINSLEINIIKSSII